MTTSAPNSASRTTTDEPIDLDLLAYDVADMLSRFEYPLDVSADDIRPALPAFLEQLRASASSDEQSSPDAARWRPGDADPDPSPQTGRTPRMSHTAWSCSQRTELGATDRHEWYWRCPERGCRVWAGPYCDALAAKRPGMDHRHYAHDLPKARAKRARAAR